LKADRDFDDRSGGAVETGAESDDENVVNAVAVGDLKVGAGLSEGILDWRIRG
jgi:hypothetical protein